LAFHEAVAVVAIAAGDVNRSTRSTNEERMHARRTVRAMRLDARSAARVFRVRDVNSDCRRSVLHTVGDADGNLTLLKDGATETS